VSCAVAGLGARARQDFGEVFVPVEDRLDVDGRFAVCVQRRTCLCEC
jgi:hypothetical protein